MGGSKAKKVDLKQGTFYLRDLRETNWGWFQRELFDFFAPLIGPYAVVIYACLCCLTRGSDPTFRISQRDLERTWTRKGFRPALSKTSIQRALRLLLNAGMLIEVDRGSSRQAPTYALVSLRKLAAELEVDGCDNLALVLEYQRQRKNAQGASSGPVGTTPAGLGADPNSGRRPAKKLRKSSGKACGNDHLSTEIPGPPEVPTDALAVPTGTALLLDKEKHKEHKPPYPPLSGGRSTSPVQNEGPGTPAGRPASPAPRANTGERSDT